MRGDALAQIDALADVERQRIVAVEEIDAGRSRASASSASGGSCGGRLGMRRMRSRRGLDRVGLEVAVQALHERPQRARVAERAMALRHVDAVARDHRIEAVPIRFAETGGATAAPCTARAR